MKKIYVKPISEIYSVAINPVMEVNISRGTDAGDGETGEVDAKGGDWDDEDDF